jgi:hypothetical protein
MSEHLKANFKVKRKKSPKSEPEKSTVVEEFEREALRHLGGSIAFVMKRKEFVWTGEEKAKE